MRKRLHKARPFILVTLWLGLLGLTTYLYKYYVEKVDDTIPNDQQFCGFEQLHSESCLKNFAAGQDVQALFTKKTGKYKELASFDFVTQHVDCKGNDQQLAECWKAITQGMNSKQVELFSLKNAKESSTAAAVLSCIIIGLIILGIFGVKSFIKRTRLFSCPSNQSTTEGESMPLYERTLNR